MDSTPSAKNRSLRDYAVLLLKGMGMGAADVVPGVSGGTIALITGIYDELLHSLKQIGPKALVVLFKEGFFSAWRFINGNFLLAVFGGILISMKTLAAVIGFCLDNYPLLVWAFFTGLIGASIVLLVRHQKQWAWQQVLACILGAAVVYGVSVLTPAQLPGHWWILFLGGFVAICAMILPGISGSFILLLVGLYPVILNALTELDIASLAIFGMGCACGLMVFSRFLSWLLDRFYPTTLATLIGFLIGSLNVTWPWKQTLETTINRHGEIVPLVQQNISPLSYESIVGQNPEMLPALLLCLFGLGAVLFVEWLSSRS